MRAQQILQAADVRLGRRRRELAVAVQPQPAREAVARGSQVVHLVGRDPAERLAGLAVGTAAPDVAHLHLQHQHRVFHDRLSVLVVQLAVERDLDRSRAVGQRDHDQAIRALRLELAHGFNHAGDHLVRLAETTAAIFATATATGRRGQRGERRAHEAADLVAVGRIRMAGEVEAERRLLLAQLHAAIPGRGLGQRDLRTRLGLAGAEQGHLLRVALALLGRGDRDADPGQLPCAVFVEPVERTGACQRLDHPSVDQPLVDARTEVEHVAERAGLRARGRDRIDRRLTGALDRAQPEADGLPVDRHEAVLAAVHVGRQHGEPVVLRVLAQGTHLVGIVHHRGEVGCEERGRVVHLEPCGLVGHQRIGGCMRLVEPVAGELLHQVEHLVRPVAVDAGFRRAFGEDLAVLRHLLGLLLAHRPAQQVGAAERVSAHPLRHLHHLLLVDHDAVGLGQDFLDPRVGVRHFMPAVLAVAELGDQVHRARPVQRDQRDDVLEAVRTRELEQVAHAARFELEHRGGVRAREQPVRLGVVERQLVQAHVGVRVDARDELEGPVEDGQRGQPQEVELDQTDRLDVVLVELADRRLGAGRHVQRAEIGQLAGGDQHAAGVHADVSHDAFQALAERKQFGDFLFGLFARLDLRLDLARVDHAGVALAFAPAQRHQLARLERDQLGDRVAEQERQVERPAGVAHHRARGHRPERDDLRHALRTVLLAHVADDPVAALLAEVDVEVGHRYPFRVQEALEQQVVAQRVEVGDAQRIRDQRAGARSPARADGHPVLLRPVDEVGDDQEVAREAHLDDGGDLEREPLAVARHLALALLGMRIEQLHARLEAALRFHAQEIIEGHAVGRREQRQVRAAQRELEVATLRDLDRIGQRRGQVGEAPGHFIGRQQVLVGGEVLRPPLVAQRIALGDADTGLVCLEVVRIQELDRMGRHHRQAEPRGQRSGGAQLGLVVGVASALQFEVETAGEPGRPLVRQRLGQRLVATEQCRTDLALARTGERDQAIATLAIEPFAPQFRPAAMLVLTVGAGDQFAQPPVARRRLAEQQHAHRPVTVGILGDHHVDTGDRFHAARHRRAVELDQAEQVRRIGDRQRRHAQRLRTLERRIRLQQAVADRILAVQAKVDKGRLGHSGQASRGGRPFYARPADD